MITVEFLHASCVSLESANVRGPYYLIVDDARFRELQQDPEFKARALFTNPLSITDTLHERFRACIDGIVVLKPERDLSRTSPYDW